MIEMVAHLLLKGLFELFRAGGQVFVEEDRPPSLWIVSSLGTLENFVGNQANPVRQGQLPFAGQLQQLLPAWGVHFVAKGLAQNSLLLAKEVPESRGAVSGPGPAGPGHRSADEVGASASRRDPNWTVAESGNCQAGTVPLCPGKKRIRVEPVWTKHGWCWDWLGRRL